MRQRLASRSVSSPVLASFCALLALNASCGGAAADADGAPPDAAANEPAGDDIVRGRADNGRDPAVVALLLGDDGLCTASLIAPRAVLTARHCVSTLVSDAVDCSRPGAQISGQLDPRTLAVVTGDDAFGGRAVAHGVRVLVPSSNRLCNADVAVVVLDRDVRGIAPLSVNLDRAPRAGDRLTLVGYGRRGNATGAGVRQRRANVPVLAVSAHEFEIGQGTCSGDSGGPALDAAGAVVGVVSRGDSDCSSGDAQNLYSRVDAWASLVRQGIQLGGG